MIRTVVVDEQERFRRGLVALLGSVADVQVVGDASSVEESREVWAHAQPQVVVIDLVASQAGAPRDCFDFIGEASHSSKIVVLTASERENDLHAAVRAGASGYVLKDSTLDELVQAIRVVADGQSLISPVMAMKLLDEYKNAAENQPAGQSGQTLTPRELEVLRLVATGLSNRDLAARLGIAENTVKNHVRNILDKLGLHSRVEAVMYAVKAKLVDVA